MKKLRLWLGISLLASCQTLRPEEMASNQASFGGHIPGTVAVVIDGGSGAVKWYSGTVEPEELRQAVSLSLEGSDLFDGIDHRDTADYLLGANLTYAGSHPGFNLSAWLNISWSLFSTQEDLNVWEEEIKTEGEASFAEAFNATTRQYIALERAGRANIEQAFAALAKLSP